MFKHFMTAAVVGGVAFAAPTLAGAQTTSPMPSPTTPTTQPSPTQPAPTPGAPAQPSLAQDSAAARSSSETAGTQNIVQTALASGRFNTLAKALVTSGLVATLSAEGPFTVFAPTDEAFAKLPKEQLEALMSDRESLAKLLQYHVVAGRVSSADVAKLTEAKSVAGAPITVSATGGTVTLNGTAKVTKADVAATNGVIHAIDTVLLPSGAGK